MKKLLLVCFFLLWSGIANAEMILNSSIGNDPDKEKLCASRALRTLKGKVVPFEIDSEYINRSRRDHPDVTFVAIDDGMSPQLVECHLNPGTGRYEPVSFFTEQPGYERAPKGSLWSFHTIRPKGFDPGINTDAGRQMAAKICMKAVQDRSEPNGFDHIVYNAVIEVPLRASGTAIRAGTSIGGKKAQRYDIVVKGTSFYASSNPDLIAVAYTCLLSPILEVKAIELKK